MFLTLHRLYVLTWTTLLVGGVMWLYPRSGISEPVRDWYAVWQNRAEGGAKPVGSLSGTVVKIIDGGSLTLRADDRQLYSVALLGVVPPAFTPSSAEGELAKRSKERLSALVLSNRVDVTLTWIDQQRRGVGVVHSGETNVNAAMVQSGLVQLKRGFIKGLPLLDQYAIVRAARKAQEVK